MIADEQDGVVYQYLLVELHGARTNILGLWSSSIALTLLAIASFSSQFQIVAPFAAIFAVILLYLLIRYLGYLAAVKGVARNYAAGSRVGPLRDALRSRVFPKEVRITTYRPEEESGRVSE